MATNITPGYQNNINGIQVRTSGTSMQRVTDRPIDTTGDGVDEKVSITHVSGHAVGTPSAPGGKIRQTVNTPAGAARTVIDQTMETDGGLETDKDVNEFTEGV